MQTPPSQIECWERGVSTASCTCTAEVVHLEVEFEDFNGGGRLPSKVDIAGKNGQLVTPCVSGNNCGILE